MDRHAQTQFVRELTLNVLRTVEAKISSGAIPEEWDGHELRQYLADSFTAEATRVMRDDRKRRKAYQNAVIVNNL